MQSSLTHFIIVADDLTGAADTAARCFGAGLPAVVYPKPLQHDLAAGAAAFTSDSRHMQAAQAAQAVAELIAGIDAPPQAIWYKKIDSTLRGNLGSELDAMLRALADSQSRNVAPACAVICPAFPDQGRGLRQGELVLHAGGAQNILLPARLAEQTARPQVTIALADVRAGAAHLGQHMQKSVQEGAQFLIIDALTNADLATIVTAARQAVRQALFCGSAGLAGALARQLWQQHSSTSSHAADRTWSAAETATLVVAGSGNPIAQQQIQQLRGKRHVRAIEWQAQPASALDPELMVSHSALLMHLPPPPASAQLDGPEARIQADRLGEQAASAWQIVQPRRVILTGGDTAMAVLSKVGIARLQIIEEVMPGIPLALGQDKWGRVVQVILKPGGFGDEQTLATLIDIEC